MIVLGISASPRKKGNTEILVKEALTSAGRLGAETVFWTVAGKKINGCQACLGCTPDGECVQEDDMTELYPLLIKADGLIFGSPVYYWSVSSQAKAVIDRTFCFYHDQVLGGKVGAGIVSTWTRGSTSALQSIHGALLQNGMYIGGDNNVLVTGFSSSIDRGSLVGTGSPEGESPANDPWSQARECGRAVVNSIRRLKGHPS